MAKTQLGKPGTANPLKLNPLQLRTMVLFQELGRHRETSSLQENGESFVSSLPQPHGNHFHVGSKLVMSKDATGLSNQSVWAALERKGLLRGHYPFALTLTIEGLAYETGMADQILHGSDH